MKNISTGEQRVQLIFMLIYFLLWELQSNSITAAAHSLEATKRHSWKQAQKAFCPQTLYTAVWGTLSSLRQINVHFQRSCITSADWLSANFTEI